MALPGGRRSLTGLFLGPRRLGRDGRMDGFVSSPIDPLTTETVGGVAIADPSSLTCSTTGPGTIPPPGSVTG